MAKLFKWFFILLAFAGVLGVAAALSLHYWLGSGDFRTRIEAQSSAFIGVPVTLSRVHLTFWPQPAIALDGVQVRTTPVVIAKNLKWVAPMDLSKYPMPPADLPLVGLLRDLL